MTTANGPLSHVKVLDLSRILAAPWASQILADLGADVIKVERPGAGDDTRTWGPPFLKDAEGKDTNEAGYYLAVNRGKRSITVSLEKPEGQRIVKELAAKADIVLENYKAGTLKRYGLDEASLRKINPRLIYCSVTGFGQTGPRRDQPAYDFLIQAMGGMMSVTGERDGKPGGGPQKVGVPIVDLMTGMYTAVSVLAALARRNETGIGDNIDIAMLDVQVATLSNQAMNYLVSGKVPRRNGNAHPNIQPQDVYACADGDVILVVGNDGQFAKLCEVFGRTEWIADERFATNAQRVRNIGELSGMLRDVFARVGARPPDRRARQGRRAVRPDQHRGGCVQGTANQGARDAALRAAPERGRRAAGREPHALCRIAAADTGARHPCLAREVQRRHPGGALSATARTASQSAAQRGSDLMTEKMKLHWSPKSPYVRKVMVCAHELGVVDRLDLVRSVAAMLKPNPSIMADNPLSKIPTLVREDGSTLFDSIVICEYLNYRAGARCFRHRARRAGSKRCAGMRWAMACSTC